MASRTRHWLVQRQPTTTLSRRNFLTFIFAGIVSGVAGCAGNQSLISHSEASPTPVPSPSPTIAVNAPLQSITPENATKLVQLFALTADGAVRSVAWSPDGHMVAGGSLDVQIWDAQTGKLLARLSRANDSSLVYGLSWSPDGSLLAAARLAGSEVWDVKRNTLRFFLPGHNPQPTCTRGECFGTLGVAWSPDGKRLIGGNGDGTVQVWDALTGKQLLALQGPPYVVKSNDASYPIGAIFGVTWSPDGKRFVSTRYDGTLHIWDARTNQHLFFLTYPAGNLTVNEVAFAPQGHLLASSSDDGTVRLWDLDKRRAVGVLDDGGQYGFANAVSWSPDGQMLVASRGAGAASIWQISPARQVTTLTVSPSQSVEVWGAGWSPDGKRIAIGSDGVELQIWGIPL